MVSGRGLGGQCASRYTESTSQTLVALWTHSCLHCATHEYVTQLGLCAMTQLNLYVRPL